MSRSAGFRCLLLTLALAMLAVPAAATASPLGFPFDLPARLPAQLRDQVPKQMAPSNSGLPFQPTFALEANNGYRIGVIGVGNAVVLEVVHGRAHAMTAYVARGTVTPGRIEASFGKFGKVAMRFQSSAAQTQHRPCKGAGRFLRRSGVFVGSVRFRGEDGYLSVDAHRAKGQVTSLAPRCWRGALARPAQHAIRPPQGDGWGLEITSLNASWRKGVNSTSFATIGFGSKALFFALSQQSQGPLAIFRIAVASAARAFTINDPLTRARVSPPVPFYGTGIYRAAPDGSKTWTGKLAANFPGAPRLSLTGPEFKTRLDAGF